MAVSTGVYVLATVATRNPWGIGVAKSNPGLREEFNAALADVIAAAGSRPGGITYATIGAGSLGHLTMVRLCKQAGVELTHVPYRGGGPAMADAIAGHVDLIVGSAALVNPRLEAKALRPLVQFGNLVADIQSKPQTTELFASMCPHKAAKQLPAILWCNANAPVGDTNTNLVHIKT